MKRGLDYYYMIERRRQARNDRISWSLCNKSRTRYSLVSLVKGMLTNPEHLLFLWKLRKSLDLEFQVFRLRPAKSAYTYSIGLGLDSPTPIIMFIRIAILFNSAVVGMVYPADVITKRCASLCWCMPIWCSSLRSF